MEKIVFFGTSDRSAPILEALKQNFELVLCVTKDNVLVGRHQTPKEVEVKKWAKENRVNYYTIKDSLKNESYSVIEQIKTSGAKLGIVADFGFIVPQDILDIFTKGLINIHFSLLPKYRGASPVQFAILNQDKETGVTYQLMEYALDKGPIISQLPYPLLGTETSGELYEKLFGVAADNLPSILLDYLKGDRIPQPQDESKASYTYSPSHPNNTHIFKEDAKLDWNNPVRATEAAIRAYNPWPVAWTTLIELEKAKKNIVGFTALKDQEHLAKTVKLHSAQLALDGRLGILQIQVEGGKVLSWDQFKNGYLV